MITGGYIYFLTNQYNKVLYLGVTNELVRRIAEHKAKINKGFSYKYNCDKLVYFEVYHTVIDAIYREKQLKNWKRAWKDALINGMNPNWSDLSLDLGVTPEYIQEIKSAYKIAGQTRNDDLV